MATEKRRAAMSLDTDAEAVAVLADPDEHLLELPGVRRFMISLTGRAFEKALLWRLDWFSFMFAGHHRSFFFSFFLPVVNHYYLSDNHKTRS